MYRGQWAIVAPGRYIGRPAILSQPSRGAGGAGGTGGAGEAGGCLQQVRTVAPS